MSPAARSARKVVELYNLVLRNERNLDLGSMEIFRVVAGKITEVWNCGYKQGVWS
jgi:hypothetical protein